MQQSEERVIHCQACSRLVKLPDGAQEGDVVACPFCGSKNRLRLLTVFVGDPVEEA